MRTVTCPTSKTPHEHVEKSHERQLPSCERGVLDCLGLHDTGLIFLPRFIPIAPDLDSQARLAHDPVYTSRESGSRWFIP